MYFPSVKKIWTPSYIEIVKMIKELWNTNECKDFVRYINDVLNGKNPKYYKLDSQDISKERFNKICKISKASFRASFDKVVGFDGKFALFPKFVSMQFLKLLNLIFKAEDSGIYSRVVSYIVLHEGVKLNKSPQEGVDEEIKYENKLKEDYIDNKIFEILISVLEQTLYLDKDIGKGDLEYPDMDITLEGKFIDELMLKGRVFIENVYKRISYKNNIFKYYFKKPFKIQGLHSIHCLRGMAQR